MKQLQILKQDEVSLMRWQGERHCAAQIQRAMQEDRFLLYAQLIQPLNPEHKDLHYEVLLRMLSEDGAMLPPAAFLPAAEHHQLMPEIDRWVIERALTQLSEYLLGLSEQPCRISLNLSAQSLCDKSFQQFTIDRIDLSGIPAEWICFEITESAAIANLNLINGFIADIKDRGTRFSVDDCGTGPNSLAYLKNLNVDFLKIDGAIVRKIGADPVSRAMVSAINQVGHTLGLQTIAKFVENDEIHKCLMQLNVDYGQGFGLGRPQPFDQLLQYLTIRPVELMAAGAMR